MIFGEEDSQQPPRHPQQQVRLDATGLDTVYANAFALTSSADEITVYLGVNSPLPGTDMKHPVIKISHRLIVIPQHAKRLLQVLGQTVKAYEDRFGPIELPPLPRPPRAGGQG